MTDKTLGGYVRHQYRTADDSWLDARYAAACKAVGRGTLGATLDPLTIFMTGSDWERKHAAEQSELVPEWPADDMDGGVTAAHIEKAAADPSFWMSRWKEAAEQRERYKLNAHLWKETAREHIGRGRTFTGYREAMEGSVKIVVEQRDDADKQAARAEEERGKALRETDRWREHAKAASERAERAERKLRATEESLRVQRLQPRGFTAEDITDKMVERAVAANYAPTPARESITSYMRHILTAALTEPPARHPEAERFDPIIDAAIRGHSDITDPAVVHAIADALAEEGVCAPEGSGR